MLTDLCRTVVALRETPEDGRLYHVKSIPFSTQLLLIMVLLGSSSLYSTRAQGKGFTLRKADDRIALQGTWRAVAATSNGDAAPKAILNKLTLVFRGDTVSIMGSRPTRFKVDSRATPSRIDLLNSKRQVGIYKLEGNTLKLCTGQNGDRPSSFATKPHTDYTYLLLKRVKK